MIVREADKMRTGTDAAVLDISMSSLLLSTRGPFAVDEQIKLRLRNIVQRFEKEARGVVRKVDVNADGSTTLTLELLTRLSALEVSMLKMGIATGEAGSGSKWV
jgi:DNA phosphorothioation-dependent restriction protein DptG